MQKQGSFRTHMFLIVKLQILLRQNIETPQHYCQEVNVSNI